MTNKGSEKYPKPFRCLYIKISEYQNITAVVFSEIFSYPIASVVKLTVDIAPTLVYLTFAVIGNYKGFVCPRSIIA